MTKANDWEITQVCSSLWRGWSLDAASGVVVEVMDSCGYAFTERARGLCVGVAVQTVQDAREHLPNLPREILITVLADDEVIPETGDLGAAVAPGYVRWTVAPSYPEGVEGVILRRFRPALFHELHHLARGWVMYGYSPALGDGLLDSVISEGLATVFEREMTGIRPPWGRYPAEVEEWVEEMLNLPQAASYEHWMYKHPDGRRWVGYKVGAYIVEKAEANSGLSAAEMVTFPTEQVLKMAGIQRFV